LSKSFEKYQKRRLRSSYLSVIISIGLVLFLLGLLGFIVLKTTSITKHFKEKVVLTVFLNDNAKNKDVEILQAELKKADYTKSVTYISKKEAAEKYSEDIGEDFLEFLPNLLHFRQTNHLVGTFFLLHAKKMCKIEV
jgi:cell division transport system permease protein